MEIPMKLNTLKTESSSTFDYDSNQGRNYDLCPLPDLLSFEQPPFHHQLQPTAGIPWSTPIMSRSSMTLPPSEIARKRRKKISDRIKALEALMPWETKMSMGTMLEEAQKYIKFLQAQVTALQTMPISSPFGSERFGPVRNEMEMLNRQQMLTVTVNSAAAQNLMMKMGVCVYTAEQVAELGKSAPVMMMLLGSTSSSRSR